MTECLFAYGTLQRPEIQRMVFGCTIRGSGDVLSGYEKCTVRIEGVYYPNIEPARGARVEGMAIDVSVAQLARADAYEGGEYRRLQVKLASGVRAWVYCARHEAR